MYLADDLVESANHLDDGVVRRQATRSTSKMCCVALPRSSRKSNQRSYSMRAQNAWSRLRSDVDSLATEYRLTWNWNASAYPYPRYATGPNYQTYERLSGTYQWTRLAARIRVERSSRRRVGCRLPSAIACRRRCRAVSIGLRSSRWSARRVA